MSGRARRPESRDEAVSRGLPWRSRAGNWHSSRWWRGHWMSRQTCGRWRDDGGPYQCAKDHGHAGAHGFKFTNELHGFTRRRRRYLAEIARAEAKTGRRRPAARTDAQRHAGEYREYLESRYSAAESATNGKLVSKDGSARGIAARQWFTGRRPSIRYATDEFRDWLGEHPILTAAEYRAQRRPSAGVHPYDF